MSLTIYLEDQLHRRGRAVLDDANNTFLNLCRRLAQAGTRVLDIIDPYADAMFNYIQLDRLVCDLDGALGCDLSTVERALAQQVRDLAAEARTVSGYLFIEAD